MKSRKLRSYLTMIGIFIGVASVVALIGLGEGLRTAIFSIFSSFGTDILSIQAGGVQSGPPGTGVINPLVLDDIDKINRINGVKIAFSRIIRTLKMEYNEEMNLVYVASIVDGEARKLIERVINLEIAQGRMLRDGDRYKVVIGPNYAK